jgi:Rps23 Pro-64 3,4-dihydroxylase Tpa1-like proline 4-hydroxylase
MARFWTGRSSNKPTSNPRALIPAKGAESIASTRMFAWDSNSTGLGRSSRSSRNGCSTDLGISLRPQATGAPEPQSLEFEITASGDGAHFAPHIDIALGAGRRTVGKEEGEDRVISTVYYFHRDPKGFTGGALRLYRFGVDPSEAQDHDSVAFEPVQNSLVAFPSFARHSVERVHCPSGEFADYRFGLNCFFCRRLGS